MRSVREYEDLPFAQPCEANGCKNVISPRYTRGATLCHWHRLKKQSRGVPHELQVQDKAARAYLLWAEKSSALANEG